MLNTALDDNISNELRFLLFEIGLNLKTSDLNRCIDKSREKTLRKLKAAARAEGLLSKEIAGVCPFVFLENLKRMILAHNCSARFWRWEGFAHELQESVANLALQNAYRANWHTILTNSGEKGLWQWALANLNAEQRLGFFEQWGTTGHPYHPNCKAKIGLSRREVIHYSPEFQAQFDIYWLAVHKQFAQSSSSDYIELIARSFPRETALWRESLRSKKYLLEDYYPVPVHPWQYRNKLLDSFKEQFSEGMIIRTSVKQQVTPTMAFRTVMPQNSAAPHIKLATAVHTTSAMRTVSSHSVHNGPRLSQILNQLLKKTGHFDNSLYLLKDLGGAHAQHTEGRHLSVLFRENPLNYLEQDETGMVLATLFNRSPFSGKALLSEIVTCSGLAPRDYFSHYCQRLLKGQMSLYLKYGIALEAHQQNTLMVFKNNLAIKHLNRDLGGVRIYKPLLQRAGYLLNLKENSLTTP